jgi:hypothetical protein
MFRLMSRHGRPYKANGGNTNGDKRDDEEVNDRKTGGEETCDENGGAFGLLQYFAGKILVEV